jgi:hypothetical protein
MAKSIHHWLEEGRERGPNISDSHRSERPPIFEKQHKSIWAEAQYGAADPRALAAPAWDPRVCINNQAHIEHWKQSNATG